MMCEGCFGPGSSRITCAYMRHKEPRLDENCPHCAGSTEEVSLKNSVEPYSGGVASKEGLSLQHHPDSHHAPVTVSQCFRAKAPHPRGREPGGDRRGQRPGDQGDPHRPGRRSSGPEDDWSWGRHWDGWIWG